MAGCCFIRSLVFGIGILLWFGTWSSQAVPTVEKECVVHPLPEEVLGHLLTAANASLRLLQDKELQGQDGRPSSVSSLRDALNLGAHPDLLVLLLHTMEREQAQQDLELSRLKEELSIIAGRATEGKSNELNQDSSCTTDSVLRAIIDLQMEVKSLGGNQQLQQQQLQQPHSAITLTQHDALIGMTTDITTEATTCYPADKWPHDCYDVGRQGKNESGVYTIYPHRCARDRRSVRVWCDFDDDDDDVWTVVLSRRPLDEQVNFNRMWMDYRTGFGDPETEHWIGNDVLHDLTSDRPQILRVEMTDWDGNQRYAEYHTFLVEDEDAEYRLHLGQYSGNAGSSFNGHDNMRFSTSDRDNDIHNTYNCAEGHHGGFWYHKCHGTSPTSLLLEKQKSTQGITWHSWYSDFTTLKEIQFKLKPKPCYTY